MQARRLVPGLAHLFKLVVMKHHAFLLSAVVGVRALAVVVPPRGDSCRLVFTVKIVQGKTKQN